MKTKYTLSIITFLLFTSACGNSTKIKSSTELPSTDVSFTSISPTSGLVIGGTSVTITGSNFKSGTTVKFGTEACTNLIIVSSTELTCDTPANNNGSFSIVLTNPDQSTVTLENAFIYGNVAPSYTSVSPTSFINTQSTNLTITGIGFLDNEDGKTSVTIGGQNCSSVSVASASQLTCASPTGLGTGAFDLVITNPDAQTDTGASAFTFRTPPTYTELLGGGPKGVLGNSCAGCHGGQNGLTVGNYASISARISAGDPENSVLWQRMNGIGNIMPTGGMLPSGSIQHVTDWILDGAQNN